MIKFKVIYLQPKKKSGYYSQQEVVFYDERDAMMWQKHIQKQDCKDIEIVPVFSK